MSTTDNSIALKQGIIQEEIINKNYDKEKFLQFCINKKEGGDDLANWSLLELNNVIMEFINQEQGVVQQPQIGQPQQNQGQPSDKPGENSNEKPKQINLDINKLNVSLDKPMIGNFTQKEFNCKKLEKTPLSDKEVTVVLRNPKTTERTLFEGAYVTYEVFTESMQWIVRRRFNDFLWLRSILVKCYPRLMVPPIPSKKMGSRRFEEDFIKKRMSFLQKFIDSVMTSEDFKTSEALIGFLSITDRNQFDSKMKELTSYQPSPYIEDLKTLSGKLTVEYNESNEKYYSNVFNYFRLQGQLYERLNYNMKQFYNSMTDAVTNLQEVQKDLETLHLLNSKIQMKDEITKTIQELGIFFKNWKRILFNQNNIVKREIKHFFKYLKMEGDCYSELINSRQNILNKYKSDLVSLNTKKEKLWPLMDPSKWEIIEDFNNRSDPTLLIQNKEYAFSRMCTKETQQLESIHKQLGYANKMNCEQLKILIDTNAVRFVEKAKEFAEKFYPTLSDSINVWSSLNSYL
ncbi:MAG: hypothetical protein MJ252_20305 [archaeon]|nr:hypothetical protein [archaeon]